MNQDAKGPGVKIPPPALMLGVLLISGTAEYLWPTSFGLAQWFKFFGLGIGLIAILVVVLSILSFKRHKTHVEPWKPTSSIVTHGVFAFSRNPIYLSFCLLQIGGGILRDSYWVVGGSVFTAVLIYFLAIRKEEGYLEAKFGEEYLRYKASVRRWI